MSIAASWARVLLAVLVYLGAALGASISTKKVGANLKDLQGRASKAIVLIGLIANLAVLAVVVLLLVTLDGRPITSLGLSVDDRDAAAISLAAVLTGLLAAGFLLIMTKTGRVDIRRRTTHNPRTPDATSAAAVLAVLAAVAMQEEVLFRGYLTLNLLDEGWVVVVVASIVLFTVIHFPTNDVTAPQVVSWTLGGGVLICAYLVTGSIWVAIGLHFTIDVANVVAFAIIGRYTPVTITPPLTNLDRAQFRAIHTAALTVLLLGLYGATVSIG